MVDTQYYRLFGKNLRSLRESLGETVQHFALDCDCSAYTIQSYELGRKGPNTNRLLNICNTKGISPNQLLAGLFPEDTEQAAVSGIQVAFESLAPVERQKLSSLFHIFVKSMIDTAPSLVGADFGTRLHLLRLDTRLSVEEFAARCMIAKSTLQGYESGQYDPSVPALLQLCNVLEVSPEYLLAMRLKKTSFPNQELLCLRPRQIRALHTAVLNFINWSNK